MFWEGEGNIANSGLDTDTKQRMGSFICLTFSHEELLPEFLMPLAERINDAILHSLQLLIQRFDNQTYDFQLPALFLCQKLSSPPWHVPASVLRNIMS